MDTEIDFNKLWNQKKGPEKNPSGLKNALKKVKRKKISRIIMLVFLLLCTIAFLLLIRNTYTPKLFTTELGYFFILSAIVMMLLIYSRVINFQKHQQPDIDSRRFLHSLENIYKLEFFISGKIIRWYFILLSLGVCLVIYEFVIPMETSLKILTYALTIGWLAFNWFYIKPQIIKKRQKEFHQINEKISALKKQLE